MRQHQLSYWKSLILAGTCAMVSGVSLIAWVVKGWTILGAAVLSIVCIVSWLVAWGGGICLYRDSRIRGSARFVKNAGTSTG